MTIHNTSTDSTALPTATQEPYPERSHPPRHRQRTKAHRYPTGRRLLRSASLVALALTLVVPADGNAVTRRRGAGATVPQPGNTANASATNDPLAPTRPRTAFAVTSANPALIQDITGGQAVQRSGSVASLATQTVTVGGSRQVTIGALADEALAGARTVRSQIGAARSALFADPVFSEDVVETADATILTSRATFTVTNRSAAARQIPSIGVFRPKATRLNQLNSTQRAALDRYKVSLTAKPNGHPLKAAAAQSDQALLDALATGIADVTITTTVRVDKAATPTTGRFAVSNSTRAVSVPVAGQITSDASGSQHGTASGEVNHHAKFLTGWSLGDSLHVSDRFDFGIAWVEVGFHAGYTVGLRVPIEMEGTMTPARIERSGPGSFSDSYEVSVHDVAAIDGDADLYRNVGLPSDLVSNGQEFALNADAYVYAKGEVLGANFNERFPQNKLLDEGQNMRPPYGNCGNACGLDFYFPCSLTKTCINILGILKGGGQLGFNVGGTGSVSYSYESLVNNEVVSSTRRSTGSTARSHRVTTDGNSGMTQRFDTVLPSAASSATTFGYRLSDPAYEWNMSVAPLVKATATFDYIVGEADIVLGPYRLPVSINVGTINLPTHDGTRTSTDKVDGDLVVNRAANLPEVSITPARGSAQSAGSAATTSVAPKTKRKRRAIPVTTTSTIVPARRRVPGTANPPASVTPIGVPSS